MLGMVLVFQYCKSVDSFCSVLVLIDCNLYHLNHMERKVLEWVNENLWSVQFFIFPFCRAMLFKCLSHNPGISTLALWYFIIRKRCTIKYIGENGALIIASAAQWLWEPSCFKHDIAPQVVVLCLNLGHKSR